MSALGLEVRNGVSLRLNLSLFFMELGLGLRSGLWLAFGLGSGILLGLGSELGLGLWSDLGSFWLTVRFLMVRLRIWPQVWGRVSLGFGLSVRV